MIIDSHHHFWRYTAAEFGWVGDDRLRRDFLPSDFATVLRTSLVDRAITVQARQSETETAWLLELADRHANIAAVVGWLPLHSPDIESRLTIFARHSKLRGLRHVLQGEADDSYMLRPDFGRGISLLEKFGLTYDLLILPRHLPNAITLVDRHPNQMFVLDHLAKPLEAQGGDDWEKAIRKLAERRNVYCKLAAGAVEICPQNTSLELVRPFFDVALDAFGPNRLMFGSNWPLTEVAGGYHSWFDLVRAWAGPLSPSEQGDIFAGTAVAAYRLESAP